ncbi:MAG: pantoate--beta-alanine ligase [Pirellulales bacterium]|nr:pantoate--beta-alanine ligase [Pirellulales bacterium]
MVKLQTSLPELVTDPATIRALTQEAREQGKTIGLVPTMGALHDGHLSLVKASTEQCDLTVVTIFINPTQFTDKNDWTEYPRDLQSDMEKLAGGEVSLVFAPTAEDIYPHGHVTSIHIGPLEKIVEGRCRPGHFSGVATVLAKLFQMIPADTAFFGRKDYQQLKVVERLVQDLNVPIKVHGCPTIRDEDGLALSSRNVFLSQEQRQQALSIPKALKLAERRIEEGETDARAIVAGMRSELSCSGALHIDYALLADAETLKPVTTIQGPTVALIAVRVGSTRLIDNEVMMPQR